MLEGYIPIFIIIFISAAFAFLNINLSSLLGPNRPNKEKLSTYESGMEPIGTAHDRFSIKYYMVAVSFIVFDIEVVFLYPWAVSFLNFPKPEMIYSFVIGLIFIVVLAVGLIYEYKKGVLKWD
ncbi:MAG: NADH-quinone oxidoreductase subunit A [Ignavibacteriaceae bacterium]|jgi:NADH:ubiquinone oxidoreductase subunit 3 (chain A)|nr:MAG: NADH-quinone oxidoreductase subunit A [Chlorobiota bacterium]KXK05831.1 MAG: NADH dehydrogenase I subunit A [Chlorobi bacterium OLB4]MBV6398339.1 NAD(P)H-quinone oxidoreductase subunit 3 [Ignavibacteria bacterium]MCC6886070.1 NADH-quinone oxidoreductase subunit A [Ignavibacteriales bacterium]MCE7952679.1 NADH-quinone oxidoreductase subunit A [Chlorobi bacterium CHB7]MDL1886790.1 NADH-quinone oxidoreductase subunit A [Ignavibacteria bacterium CHB1]MEB2329541.1 NADH-quinone oxidoreducta